MVSADVRGFVAIAKVLSIDVRRVPPKLDPDVPQYVPQFCLDPMESGARHVLLGHTHLPAHSSGGHSTATSLTVPVSTGRPLADVVGQARPPPAPSSLEHVGGHPARTAEATAESAVRRSPTTRLRLGVTGKGLRLGMPSSSARRTPGRTGRPETRSRRRRRRTDSNWLSWAKLASSSQRLHIAAMPAPRLSDAMALLNRESTGREQYV
jgi:hypothetical protein